MTMVPAQNLYKQQYFYGGGYAYGRGFGLMSRLEGYEFSNDACLGSDFVVNSMADQDESRTNSINETGSSSKDERDEGWLQLTIGGGHSTTTHHQEHKATHHVDPTCWVAPQIPSSSATIAQRGGALIELDLLPGGGSQQARPLATAAHVPEFRAPRPLPPPGITNFSSSLFFHQHQGSSSSYPHNHQDFNWVFRSIPQNIAVTQVSTSSSSSSASSSLMVPGSYLTRPFQVPIAVDVSGSSSEFRIVDAPRRHHSGIWFMLQASQNQAKEPFLPQIPKSYLRIKDGRMTVRLLLKYLVNKLRLDSESEIEITCRGQQLLPFLTLQHVRDNIWSPKDHSVTLLNPDSSTTDHVMVLHYGRSA